MTERAVDPSGLIAGFADAAGGFLPLAATLNCTLAVDRVAGGSGSTARPSAERTEVTVLPYLDGERTPTCRARPARSRGCATTPSRADPAGRLRGRGGLAGRGARAARAASGPGWTRTRPIVLIGGGARGRVWQQHGGAPVGPRASLVPEAEELVALGAAAQAAAVLNGEPPAEIARRWDTRGGATVEPPAERDDRDAGSASAPIRAKRGARACSIRASPVSPARRPPRPAPRRRAAAPAATRPRTTPTPAAPRSASTATSRNDQTSPDTKASRTSCTSPPATSPPWRASTCAAESRAREHPLHVVDLAPRAARSAAAAACPPTPW